MRSLQAIIMSALLVTAAYGQQQPAAPAAAPAATAPAAPEVVTPKAPYDSTKAELSTAKQINYQLYSKQLTTDYQTQMKQLQDQWNAEETVLQAWEAQVRKDNGWDDSYAYDRSGNKWTHTKKAEASKEPAKEPATAPAKK